MRNPVALSGGVQIPLSSLPGQSLRVSLSGQSMRVDVKQRRVGFTFHFTAPEHPSYSIASAVIAPG